MIEDLRKAIFRIQLSQVNVVLCGAGMQDEKIGVRCNIRMCDQIFILYIKNFQNPTYNPSGIVSLNIASSQGPFECVYNDFGAGNDTL